MKKLIALVLTTVVMMLEACSGALAATCNCGCGEYSSDEYREWLMATTLIVADEDGSYDIQVNVRSEPDINSEDVGTIEGGTRLNVTDFYYTEDGRIWAEIWYHGVAYVSMKYMQPVPEKSFFYLPVRAGVYSESSSDGELIGEFYEDQLILVEKIYTNEEGEFWAVVRANEQLGYLPFRYLEPVV